MRTAFIIMGAPEVQGGPLHITAIFLTIGNIGVAGMTGSAGSL
jgi:hypothetical protein